MQIRLPYRIPTLKVYSDNQIVHAIELKCKGVNKSRPIELMATHLFNDTLIYSTSFLTKKLRIIKHQHNGNPMEEN